jgi:hypothetical protein
MRMENGQNCQSKGSCSESLWRKRWTFSSRRGRHLLIRRITTNCSNSVHRLRTLVIAKALCRKLKPLDHAQIFCLVMNSPVKQGIPHRTNSIYSPVTKYRNLQLNGYTLTSFRHHIMRQRNQKKKNVVLCINSVVSSYNATCAQYWIIPRQKQWVTQTGLLSTKKSHRTLRWVVNTSALEVPGSNPDLKTGCSKGLLLDFPQSCREMPRQ